ncbi:metal ABC transporter permease [Herbiconiux sp. CPCC 203407]|uniref:Metal ABC transporter permease n=1 Tax=Herbiconiux oxytropis TaxID=2970915 RepID=A0AA41XFA8_9MICO|nr:metal ABC transporter permease [Herbiconiux oxytropis]MCS5723013.1 metal ABC transporter permease [Herbiconiux oxytropis]MCS5725175.1 metal ABC transporter permease [Herbiconiux oxytropis]
MGYYERALVIAILLGVVCGLVGTVVVLRRRAFFTQALTHATFPGAVLAAALGANVMLGAFASSVVLIVAMTLLGRVHRQGSQVASGVVLTAGFALGVFLQAFFPELPIHVDSYLIGSILNATDGDLAATATVLVVATVTLLLTGKEILFSTLDPAGFRAAGYREWVVEAITLALVVITVVTAMPAVGAILALALVAAPAAAARLLARTTTQIFVLAPVIGALSGVIGVVASRSLGVAAGASISLTAALFFVLALGISRLQRLRWKRPAGRSSAGTEEAVRS